MGDRSDAEVPEEAAHSRVRGSRVVRVGTGAWAKGSAVADKGRYWVDRQDPATRKGAGIGWYRRFRESDGGLLAVLITAYLFVTLIPAGAVMMNYVYNNPHQLADRLDRRLGLTGSVKSMVDSVLTGVGGHQLVAALIAVADVLLFGMGFGRTLQISHARSWRIDLGRPQFFDQARYLATLVIPLGFVLIYVVQTRALHGQPSWIGWLLLPFWIIGLFLYFVWMPRELLHRRVTRRAVVPGALFTVLGFVGLLLSALLFRHWLVWYGQYYGGLGIVMALFFWVMLFASLLVLAAALSPVLAHRRDLREAQRAGVAVTA